MKKILLKVVFLTAIMALSGWATADEAAYKAAKAAAVASLDKADAVGGEWRDARWKKSTVAKVGDKKMSYLAAADAYAAKGDYKKAIEYAETAKFQGDMGYEQALDQKNAGPRF